MSGLFYGEVIEREMSVPPLVVFGSGIGPDGLSVVSKQNATAAAKLINSGLVIKSGLAPTNMAFALGDSPTNIHGLTTTEAHEMAGIIKSFDYKDGITPTVIEEDRSKDTIGNIEHLGPYVEEYELDALSIIAAIGHADRARLMVRKNLGKKIEVLPVYSIMDARTLTKARELYSIGLYGLVTAFSKPDTRRLAYGNQAYRSLMALPKRLASGSSLSKSH